VAKKRQIVLMKAPPKTARPGTPGGPLGTAKEVREALARFNTGPDGSARQTGTEVLHGPGMVLEIPQNVDEVQQAMVTVLDDDIAWPVLSRVCRHLSWKMIDLETGMSFGG